MDQVFVNQSKTSTLAGCSRNNFSKMWKKEQEHPGTYSFFSVDGKIDISHYEFIEHYGDHTKEWFDMLAEKQKAKIKPVKIIKAKPEPKPIIKKEIKKIEPVQKKRGRPPGTKKKTEPVPKVKTKKRTTKQIEQDQIKIDNENENQTAKKDPELAELQKRSAKAKHEKIILDKEKAEMELKKARAELCEIETLGHTLIGYLIALNQNLLDQPRSYVDEFKAAAKMGKSKTDLTDILRIPASDAIKNTIEVIRKEIQKYKKAIKRVEKLSDE